MKDRKFFWVLFIFLTVGLLLPQYVLAAEKPHKPVVIRSAVVEMRL